MSDVRWYLRLCREMDPELFFKPEDEQAAQRICRECPIRWECLNFALDRDERHGVWGGMTEQQRRNIRFKRPRVKCPYCANVLLDELKERMATCLACGLSWLT